MKTMIITILNESHHVNYSFESKTNAAAVAEVVSRCNLPSSGDVLIVRNGESLQFRYWNAGRNLNPINQ